MRRRDVTIDFVALMRDAERRIGSEFTLTQLFPEAFMAEHTSFESIEAMFAAGPLAETPAEDLREALTAPEWGAFVADHTRFPTWEEMLTAAGREEVQRRLKR